MEGHVRRQGNGVTLETREIRQTFITEQSRIGNKTVTSLKLLRFSGWRRLRSLHTVTLFVCVFACVCVFLSSFEGPQELTPRESKKKGEEEEKIGLTKLVLATTAVLVEMLFVIMVVMCFHGCIFRQKSANSEEKRHWRCLK